MSRKLSLAAATLLLGCAQQGGSVEHAPSGAPPSASVLPSAPQEPTADSPAAPTAIPTASGAGTGAPATPAAKDVDELGIRWRLEASPSELRLAQRAAFRLSIHATNMGTRTIDPQHGGCVVGSSPCLSSSWLLDGAPSHALDLAFGNGIREARWSALPAGESVSDARHMGESLFGRPGRYTVTYRHGSAEASVLVTVKP